TDYETLQKWVNHSFGDRATDVIFLIRHGGTPEEIRSIQTIAGRQYRGVTGGRPKKKKRMINILIFLSCMKQKERSTMK
ncbi:MAG: hypothetical protein LBE82_09955, partial [Chitinophagaceae bacterium]|nr:hypothetical protein [Chitinophagaceae bacterium]